MEQNGIHELTAAYVLHALDEHEENEYENHLRRCSRCRDDITSLQETASALAYATPAMQPPPGLRDRILERAREERPAAPVVPLRRRRLAPLLGATAAAAAAVAVGLGLWAASIQDSLDEEREAHAILADPTARQIPLEGATGRLVVASSREAALVVRGLDEAPENRTYEAWVIVGETPQPAGLFRGDDERDLVLLTRPVPRGAIVAVTVERRGGVDRPQGRPFITARAV